MCFGDDNVDNCGVFSRRQRHREYACVCVDELWEAVYR